MPRITPNLWFDTEGKDAAEFYVSVFPNSRITHVSHYGEAGPREAGTVLTVDFELDGQRLHRDQRRPRVHASARRSRCRSAARTRPRSTTTGTSSAEGGEESPCGWLKDRYGLSWQVVPSELGELLGDPDPARATRAMKAMLGMRSSTWPRSAPPPTRLAD